MNMRAGRSSLNKNVACEHFPLFSTSGFTLIEIMLVLSVVSIMMAISIPGYLKWLPNMRLKTAAQDLRANMQKTRFDAIKLNQPFAIVFDTANNSYVICSESGDGDWATLENNTQVERVELANYKSGIRFGCGEATTNATNAGGSFPGDGSFVSYGTLGNSIKPLIFNSRGAGSAGYVYLEHNEDTTSYALGTLVSGVIRVKKWAGNRWN